jgi:peptide/nickel transport system substrate-binding protein
MIKDSAWLTRSGLPESQAQDDLLAKAFATQDVTARDQIYNQLATAMVDDQVIIPIVNPNLFLASRSDIKGMHYSACCNLELALLSRG